MRISFSSEKISAAVKSALDWWLSELRSVLPSWLAPVFCNTPGAIVLEASPSGLLATSTGLKGNNRMQLTWDLETRQWSPEHKLRQLQALSRGFPVDLVVPTHLLLEQEVVLPRAAAANLMGALSYGLSNWSPFSFEEVYLAARIKSRKESQIIVMLRYGLKTHLSPLLEQAETAGVAPDRLILGNDRQGTVTINPRKMRRTHLLKRFDLALAASTAVLILVMAHVLLERQTHELAALQAAVRTGLETVGRDETAVRSLRDLHARRTIVARRRAEEPSLSDMLNAIGARLPAGAFLVSLDVANQKGRLEVEGLPVTDILPEVRKVEWLGQAKIDASPPGSPAAIMFTTARRAQ